ncbi:hypothetical protein BDF19DRAFT_424532 [Syncephalis fuscata]|nr:hypothetical protein BDF19DRAFT_424532 [Syncephalis fuscata]
MSTLVAFRMTQPHATSHSPQPSNEGDNIPLLKRKRLSDSNVAMPPSNGLSSPNSPGKASSASDNNDAEDIPLHERSPSSYSKTASPPAPTVGRMSVNGMLAEGASKSNKGHDAGLRPTPPRSNSRHASPTENPPPSTSAETTHKPSHDMAPYVKRTRLPYNYPSSTTSSVFPQTPGTIATAAPIHFSRSSHTTSTVMASSHSRGHPHPHTPHHPNGGYPNHPMHQPHSHPHPVSHMHHPHAHPQQHGQIIHHHPPHTPNSMPNVSNGTIIMASSGPVHGNPNYALQSPQQASFRNPLPSSGISGRNRLNLTVHAPAYAEGQSILVSPRPPGTGGELVSIPVTVASAGPTTTSYANTGLRSSVVAMRTAAGPLPPKAKLTPRTPVGPEASRYRRPPMSATVPPADGGMVAVMQVASSPRTETHPRRGSLNPQLVAHAEVAPSGPVAYDVPMLDHRVESEEGRRRFMSMMETMYERAFESPSRSVESSPRQQRLEVLAEQVDQAGGLEALVQERVSNTLATLLGGANNTENDAAAVIKALLTRIQRLEERLSAESTAEPIAVDDVKSENSLE